MEDCVQSFAYSLSGFRKFYGKNQEILLWPPFISTSFFTHLDGLDGINKNGAH